MHIKNVQFVHLTAINIQMADWVLDEIADTEWEANRRVGREGNV